MSHDPQAPPGASAHTAGHLDELDQALFIGPFIVLNRHNDGIATRRKLDTARSVLHQREDAVTLAGTLRPGIEGVDVDPADTGALAEAGTALVDDLRDWITGYGLAYLVRASGRPGGHHVLARVPDNLLDAYAAYVADAAERHGVRAELRVPRTFRLLSAPHRLGYAAPVLDGTLTPADVPTTSTRPARAPKSPPRPSLSSRRTPEQQTASEREYRRTCAAIRNGLTFAQTWAILEDSRVIARGQVDFRKFMWFRAQTEIAAERGLDESAAWQIASQASTARARKLGRDGWRARYWQPAVERAADPTQHRARRFTELDAPQSTQDAETAAADLERTRTAMHDAAADLIARFRPQRQKSIRAVIDALAVAITSRDGSIDVRSLAERACVSKGVTIEVKAQLTEHGVIAIPERYAGGADHCHRYALGSRAEQALPQKQTTRWYTPTPRSYGSANPEAMRLHHTRERLRWKLRCTLEDATKTTGERWSTSQHPAAKAARSLWAQRARWDALPPDVQDEKRKQRRAFLGRVAPDERRLWFDWLNHRDNLGQAAQRARSGTESASDRAQLETAPITVHLGMRDRSWLDGTAARRKRGQLQLFSEAA
ncbi:hypothetical protein ACFORH_39125 [Amycolatopsis roodepoortensis]|uniref:Uncharacterized protein n=1 Tax=Amycolatopsis roodepoortensis TaxID=700274 RepID=A0ABR9LIM3_9PSEU|nr:hypothetical protein [Amycolatopsis roodepoortensis]MBE1580529.1 hypothetical protein [Amycolatopsis roodepoortensis]